MSGEKIAWTIGVGTGYSWFCLSFFVLLLACVTHTSCSLRAWLRLSEKRGKIAPVLRNLAFSMKLRINDFLFLVFLHITTDGKKQIHQTVSTYLLYCTFWSCCLSFNQLNRLWRLDRTFINFDLDISGLTTGGPSSSYEMIILRNKSHGEIVRVWIGIFTTTLKNK